MGTPITKSKLVTSYTIKVTPKDGNIRSIGTLSNINPSERRDVTETFVIGGQYPDEPFEIVPGIVRGKSFRARFIALYTDNVLEAFGRTPNIDTLVTLSDQSEPFEVQEVVVNPENNTQKGVIYQGCWLTSYDATRDIAGGDIRVIEDVTVNYRKAVPFTGTS